jgi:DNA-directed RNA polymerase specialized sigma24 family protein
LEQQFERILVEHGGAISRLAYRYEAERSVREELVQDIALALWQALPHFRGECSERTFIFRIAHNRGLSHAGKRRLPHEPLDELKDAHHRLIRTLTRRHGRRRQINESGFCQRFNCCLSCSDR